MRNIITFLIAGTVLYSCSTIKEAPQVDLKAGVGGASMEGGSYTDPLGMQVSVEVKLIELNKNSSLSTGLGYSLQGANYKDPDYSGTVRTSYLNVPLLYTYESNGGFYAEVGLQPALLLSAKDKGTISNGGSYDENFKNSMGKVDIGVPIGGGYKFKNGLGIGARITYGLLKADKTAGESTHNLLITGILSYRFKCGKKK